MGQNKWAAPIVRHAAEKSPLSSRIHFTGWVDDASLRLLYCACDLFVFPSLTDTLGQVAMESQASGLPVLVSDAGGPQHVVKHGETGLVLPGGDHARWVGALEELRRDGSRRRAMGHAAHRAMQTMSIEDSLEDFWRVHEEVMCVHTRGSR